MFFSGGLLIGLFLAGDPIRRIKRSFVWPLAAGSCIVVAATGGLIWYVESFIPIFIEHGIADPGKIRFKKLRWDSERLAVIKYHVWDLPNCENTGFLLPWRDGHRSLSDDYLEGRRSP